MQYQQPVLQQPMQEQLPPGAPPQPYAQAPGQQVYPRL